MALFAQNGLKYTHTPSIYSVFPADQRQGRKVLPGTKDLVLAGERTRVVGLLVRHDSDTRTRLLLSSIHFSLFVRVHARSKRQRDGEVSV